MTVELTSWRDVCEHAVIQRWESTLADVGSLSDREYEVFALLGMGQSNREISVSLQISERTAKKHVGSILEKLGLDSRLQIGLAALTYRIARVVSLDPPRDFCR